MAQHYSNPKRAKDAYSLPDLETFYRTQEENREYGDVDGDDNPMPAGWYFWYCFPGCMPDSEPNGPYDTEALAVLAAREDAGTDEDDDTEGE